MRQKTINIYQFKELPEDIQEKAIQNNYDINVFYEWWNYLYDDFHEICNILGFELDEKDIVLMNGEFRKEPKIFFSGFYSQGDGLSFYGNYKYAKNSKKRIREYAPKQTNIHIIADSLFELQKKYFFGLSGKIERAYGAGNYYHENTIVFNYNYYSDCQNLPKNIVEIEEQITKQARDLMKIFYRILEKEYEYLTSEEAIKETLIANEYEFYESGAIV